MKIEKLHFSNINSLAGEFEIDFTHPYLAEPGFFVITGPTGAGKTTILDAISFALYGRSPRQGRFQTDENEIMTHGAAACFATVQYEQGGEHYLSTVSQSRSKRGSNPFGQVKCMLYKLSSEHEWELLANRKSDFDRLNEEITGLSFRNFTRCMLLAQGEFAVFLKANEKERAEILSTITGTEIYERIGEVAHERVAAVQRRIDALQSLPELSEVERTQKEQSRDAGEKELRTLQEQQTHVADCMKWIAEKEKAIAAVTQAKQKAELTARALQEFEQGKAVELQRAEAALAVQPAAVALAAADKQLHQHRQALLHAQQEQVSAQQQLQVQQQKYASAVELFNTESPQPRQQLADVREKMRPQESALKLLASAADKEKKRSVQHAAELAAVIAEKKLLAQQKATLQEQSALITAEWQQRRQDAALIEQLPLLQARLSDWESLSCSVDAIPPHSELEQQLATQLRELEQAEKRPAGLREIAELKRRQLGIEEQLAALYLDFCAGKLDCCPCCGAEVPGQRRAVLNSEVQQAELAVKQAEEALKKCRSRVAELEKLQQVSLRRLALQEVLGTPVEHLSAARRAVAALAKRRDVYQRLQRQMEGNEKKLHELQTAYTVAATRAEELERTAATAAQQAAVAEQEYTVHQQEFVQLWGQGVTAHALEQQLTAFLQTLQERVDSEKKLLQQSMLTETQKRTTLHDLSERLPVLEQAYQQSLADFSESLAKNKFEDAAAYQSAELLSEQLPALRRLREQVREGATAAAAVSSRESAALEQLLAASPLTEDDVPHELRGRWEALHTIADQRQEWLNQLLAELRADDLAHKANAEVAAQKKQLETERDRHALLKKVLGDSKDGFKKFAQQITFDMLLRRANAELRHLTNRYELCRRTTKDDPLGLAVIDRTLGISEGRNASNLSGGESFLVSLALALGLSHMTGNTRIDSLFLDEGFGTLDADTLDHVLTSLQKLRAHGKMIGIISHVPALSERISARIQVTPLRGGFSTLTGSPAVQSRS